MRNKLIINILVNFIVLALVGPNNLLAGDELYYKLARSCAEWTLRQDAYFSFFDKQMSEMVTKLSAENSQLHGHEKVVTEIYQESMRDFLTKINALEKTWDVAAKKFMAEFSENELSKVNEYQNKKVGNEFFETDEGKKWDRKAETILQSAVDDVRQSFAKGFNYDIYLKVVQDKFDLFESRGQKIPDFLVRPKNLRSYNPTDEGTALFAIFESTPKNSEQTEFTIKSEQPLMVVYSLQDCTLNKDNKGVNIRLNKNDAKALAELTRKFKGKILLLKATDTVMEGMRIVEPIENGYLEFKYPDSAQVAEYLRKRYRMAEFK